MWSLGSPRAPASRSCCRPSTKSTASRRSSIAFRIGRCGNPASSRKSPCWTVIRRMAPARSRRNSAPRSSFRAEKYTVLLDCDGTYPPEIIPRFVEKLAEGKPVVVGSRILGSIEEGAMSGTNYLGNRVLSAVASFLFQTPISDVCSGMWAFDSEQLKSLGLTADGFDIEADIFARCARKGVPIMEIPIPYHRRIGEAKLRVWEGLRIAFALLRERLLVADDLHREVPAERPSPPAGQTPQGQ